MRFTRWRGLFSIVFATLLLPSAADAQTQIKNFLHHCTSGAIRTCASVQVETLPFDIGGTSGTVVWIRIRNLQGTNPLDNTGGSLITSVGLTSPQVGLASSLTVSHLSPAQAIFGSKKQHPSNYWQITNGGIGGQVEFSSGTTGVEGGILGCDPSDANPGSYFQTCGDEGWIVFNFITDGMWTADQAEIAFGVQAMAVNGDSEQCRSGDNCLPPAEVVPEPTSMILLGSGLLGLKLMHRRRQRYGPGEEPDDDL